MWKKLLSIGKDFSFQFSRKNIAVYASGMAFFVFLSLIPILMVLCAVIPLTVVTQQDLMNAVDQVMPDFIVPLLSTIITDVYERSSGIISVAILVAVWSAGKGMLAMIRGLNEINEVDEHRNYLVLRLVASGYTLLMLCAVLLALILMVFGSTLLEVLRGYFPMAEDIIAWVKHFRFLVSWGVLTFLFAVFYSFVPSNRQKFWYQMPGAAFAAVVWSIFSFAFSIYIKYFNGFSTYGSLTAIIIIMLWLYFCFYIILLGAFLNHYFAPAYQVFFHKGKKGGKRG